MGEERGTGMFGFASHRVVHLHKVDSPSHFHLQQGKHTVLFNLHKEQKTVEQQKKADWITKHYYLTIELKNVVMFDAHQHSKSEFTAEQMIVWKHHINGMFN